MRANFFIAAVVFTIVSSAQGRAVLPKQVASTPDNNDGGRIVPVVNCSQSPEKCRVEGRSLSSTDAAEDAEIFPFIPLLGGLLGGDGRGGISASIGGTLGGVGGGIGGSAGLSGSAGIGGGLGGVAGTVGGSAGLGGSAGIGGGGDDDRIWPLNIGR